ncbi:MAG: CoA transferase, partial [Candidatus Binataceae bacterium]
DIQAKLCDAVFPKRGASMHPPNPLAAVYLTRDQKMFLLVQIDPDNEFPRLCGGVFGQPELATGALFSTNAARAENAAALHAILQAQFETRDLAEWRVIFKQHDIKWSALPTRDEAVADPQMRASGAIVKMNGEKLETVNSPVFISGVEKEAPRMAPALGEHTREVLLELGYADREIDAMINSGAIATTS